MYIFSGIGCLVGFGVSMMDRRFRNELLITFIFNVVYCYSVSSVYFTKYVKPLFLMNDSNVLSDVYENKIKGSKYKFADDDLYIYSNGRDHVISRCRLKKDEIRNKFCNSSVKCILCECKMDDMRTMTFSLQNENCNYLIQGNILNKSFFCNLMNVDENVSFVVNIIDGNVNCFTLDYTFPESKTFLYITENSFLQKEHVEEVEEEVEKEEEEVEKEEEDYGFEMIDLMDAITMFIYKKHGIEEIEEIEEIEGIEVS
jgi:hypothetical protein